MLRKQVRRICLHISKTCTVTRLLGSWITHPGWSTLTPLFLITRILDGRLRRMVRVELFTPRVCNAMAMIVSRVINCISRSSFPLPARLLLQNWRWIRNSNCKKFQHAATMLRWIFLSKVMWPIIKFETIILNLILLRGSHSPEGSGPCPNGYYCPTQTDAITCPRYALISYE